MLPLVIIGGSILVAVLAYVWILGGKPVYSVDGNKRIVAKLPSTPYFFSMALMKSLTNKKSKNITLPGISFTQTNIEIDGQRLKEYRKICGFSEDSEVPLTYPYLIIFPLQGMLLVDKAFPFPAMGVVHMANKIQQFGLLELGGKYTATVRLDEKLIPHAKGYCFVVVSEMYSAVGRLLWRSESTYLYRTKVSASATDKVYESLIKPEDVEGCVEVKPYNLADGFGLKYAAVSGDFNPIHCYAITAKLFGFPHGAITHGMWSAGACAADILPALKTITASAKNEPIAELYVEFKMPMYLPAKSLLYSQSTTVDYTDHKSHGSKRAFQILMKNKKNSELIPHVRGVCSWK